MDLRGSGHVADDLEDTIRDAATAPSSISGDAGSVTERSIDELIKADQYLAGKAAARSARLPIRMTTLRPGGAA